MTKELELLKEAYGYLKSIKQEDVDMLTKEELIEFHNSLKELQDTVEAIKEKIDQQ